jgi:hypothetical protein
LLTTSDTNFWRALRLGLFAVAALGLLWLTARTSNSIAGIRYFVLPDDAMISMRFARNFAHGLGLVWNAGERVQGYTNPAWTLLMAGVHLLPLPDRLTSLPMQVASIGFHLLTALVIWRAVARKAGSEWAMAATAAFLASSCATIWAISGWEVSAVALGWTLALAPIVDPSSSTRDRWLSLAAAAVTVTIRPDAALVFVVAAGFHVLTASREREQVSRAIFAVAMAAILPALLAIWQREYYGSWVPNTVILKRSAGMLAFGPGLRYLATSLVRYPFNFLVFAAAALYARKLPRSSRWALAVLAGVYSVHIISAGGDAFSHARFLVPLLPTATILAALAFAGVSVKRAALGYACAVAVTFVVAFDLADTVLVDVQMQKDANRLALLTSFSLGDTLQGQPAVVAVFAAGTVPYFNPSVRFHDILGKSESRIARTPPHSGKAGHNHWDYEYSLNDVRPDLVITTYPLDTRNAPLGLSGFRIITDFYQDLYDNASFDQHYLKQRVPIRFAGEEVTIFEAYVRDDGVVARRATMAAAQIRDSRLR